MAKMPNKLRREGTFSNDNGHLWKIPWLTYSIVKTENFSYKIRNKTRMPNVTTYIYSVGSFT